MQIREGKEIAHGDYGTARVISRNEVNQDLVLEADQILVGTNWTRKRYNRRLRELKGVYRRLPAVPATSWSACVTTRSRAYLTARSGRC